MQYAGKTIFGLENLRTTVVAPDDYGAHGLTSGRCAAQARCFVLSRAVLQLSCEEQAMDGAFIDNEILIAAVQHRLPLWMASHQQHKDKIVKVAMWREVAAAVLPNVNIGDVAELVQKCWKSLRDKFRRLFVANKKAKSGAGLDDVECITITWPYFQLRYFLKDTMQTRARAVLQLSCEEQATDGAFIDNEILIAAVQHRLPLWIASHRQHKDEIVKAAMWREVAAAVLPNVNIDDAAELVQKRWKSLRDKFWRLFVANKKIARSFPRGNTEEDAEHIIG
ncbi:hypothetical protein HPB51_012434 [Rhipicephalus microplus]|uniref:MADF domain-containing protein n=1 Tax=Rhipicephalus microplus TaxID=6941 RepID=A0A9J6E9F9_RHIMP|nr:hypothetical protein HPB51_012434 [Rhipicephalus microplus]